MDKYYRLNCKDGNREDYISDEYKNKIINMGSAHDGFPVSLKGYSINYQDEKLYNAAENSRRYTEINQKLQTALGTYRNALCAVYPPSGYIAWHNNANASAYNVIFTWSETGDGYWKHVDPNTGKDVLVKDVPGWQCKGFYFGSYEDDPKSLVYHMASTDCWRMTVAYVFDRRHKDHWEAVIEELETID